MHPSNVSRRRRISTASWFGLIGSWPQNHLLRNALYLAATSIVTAGLGFCFWAVVARLFTPHEVGIATSLISTVSLVAYLSLFGLNSSLIRFLPVADRSDALITQAVAGVIMVSAVVGTGTVLVLPQIAPELAVVADPTYAVLFVVFAALTAVNLLTDAVFIAERKSQYNVLADGLLQGLTRLIVPFFVVGVGALGVFIASGLGAAAAVAASFICMHVAIGARPDLRPRHTALTRQLRYSSGTYVSSVLNLVPVLVVPLIVLQQLGAADAGFYYVAFQVAGLLTAFAAAIGESLFAEGSHDAEQLGALLRRSARLLALALLPTTTLICVASSVILAIFGEPYRNAATWLLVLLAANGIFVGLNTWASFTLKIIGAMRPLIVSNLVYSGAVIGATLLLAGRGLTWVGLAWLIGTAASGLVAVVAVRRRLSAGSAAVDVSPVPS